MIWTERLARDTFVPYVAGLLLRRPWRAPRLVLALPALLAYPLGLADRGQLKGALIRAALGGLQRTAWPRGPSVT